ncbi:SpvB/TcaC N-terminal domain-containing protein, partial [Microbulbifer sp. 2205BS26-8]|uniref:SpvB/TcaC N-terminal domain-containing protein n=1 Tax=Microbulbifer sp. 2205BS26-8 TaxID=3064386 RepID=UPI00273EC176
SNWIYSNTIKVIRKPNMPGSASFSNNEGGTDRNGSFKLNWGASNTPPKVTGYQVDQCKDACSSSGTWSQIYSAASTGRSITVPSSGKLTNGSYRYRVRAFVTVSGTSKYSDWRYSPDITVNRRPDEVTHFTQPGSGTQTANFQVAWSGVTGSFDPVTRYQIQCSINGGSFTFTPCGNDNTGTATTHPVNLPAGTEGTYTFRVRAYNSQGWGPWTRDSYQKSVSVNIPLPPPHSLSIQAPESSEFGDYDIAWSGQGTITSYQLQKQCKTGTATCGVNGWHAVQLSGALSRTYAARGHVADQYRYRVRACNVDACSPWKTSPWVAVHNLEGITPAVSLSPGHTPGALPYSAEVSQQGDAEISIPLQGAPGVNGLVPRIDIHYSGARFRERNNESLPEDFLGYGWRLSGFGEIRRCVVGRPNADEIALDTSDSLCLNGKPLVLVSGAHFQPGAKYHTQEESFHSIEIMRNTEEDTIARRWFRVQSPDGHIREYGNTPDSRLGVGTSAKFGWSLNKVTDTFDNTIRYKYHNDTVEGINYPLEVVYGNAGDAKITFEYGTRSDAPPQPLGPGDIQQEQLVLLHHVKVSLNNQLLRAYKFISEDEGEVENYRRLKHLQLCAYNENGTNPQCLEPMTFNWIEPNGANPIDFKTGIAEVIDTVGKAVQFHHTMISATASDGLFFERPFGQGIVPAEASPLQPVGGEYRCVVSEVWRSNGVANGWHKTAYSYQGTGLVSDRNRGFLGYYAQKAHDLESGRVTYRQFRLDYPHIGTVSRVHEYEGPYPAHSQVLAKQQFRDETIALAFPKASTLHTVPAQRVDTVYEGGQVIGYHVTGFEHSKKSYGGYGEFIDGRLKTEQYVTNATLPNTQSFWGEVKPVAVSGVLRSQETASSFTTRTGKWLIGFKDGEEQRYYSGDTNISPDQVNTVVYTPFADNNKIQSMTRLPGDAKYELTTRYTYDAKGNLTTERVTGVQVAERTTTYSNFIDARYPARVQNALGQITTLGYDQRFGQQNRITRDNRTTAMAYDAFGREQSRTDTDGVTFTTVRAFCSAGSCPVYGNQLVAFKVSTSSTVSPASDRYYDILGRLIQQDTQSFDGSALTRTEYNYDLQGRLYLETAPFFVGEYKPITTYHYDIQDRRTAIHRPDGSQTRTLYSALPASNQFKVRVEHDVFSSAGTLGEIQVKESLYSVSGDLVSSTDAAGTADAVTTSYQYTGSGQMQSAIVNNNSATEATFSYDLAGYQSTLTDPSVGTVRKTFNALGELVQQTDNLGQSTAYYYDTLGRMRFKEDAHGVAHWQYDPGNALGALSRQRYIEGAVVQSGSVVGGQTVYDETHTYNPAGKLQDKAFTVTAGGLSRQYQYHYAYDGQGRISSLTYPSGVSAHYAYNSRGYLHKITDGTRDLKVFGRKNARLQTEEAVFGNGVVTVKTYGRENGRLQGLLTAGASEIQDNNYRWRSNGTLESRQVYGAGNTAQKEVFAYDALNRLETAETLINGTSRRTLTTRYDRLGNIEEKTSSLPGDAAVSGYQYGGLGHAGPHAVSGATINGTPYALHYNRNGAITHYDAASGDDKWISWNARQLPTEIVVGTGQNTQSPTARDRFKYGPNGNRYYRESSWWDPSRQQLVTEKTFILEDYEDLLPGNDPDYQRIQKATIDSSVLQISATEHTGLPLATLEYLHRDHLGSIEKITDADGNLLTGATGSFGYDPFGARRESDWSGTLGAQSLTDLLASQGLSTKRGFT